jgi:nitrogen fixation protein FixH
MISAARRWALTPVALLLACIGGQVVLVRATRGQPGLAVDEGYDERARRFDELEAGARKGEALGWRLDVTGGAALEVRITDGAGQPVAGARVVCRALSLSGGSGGDLRLEERAPGVYAAALPGPGRWELRLRVERDDARLERTVLRDVAP